MCLNNAFQRGLGKLSPPTSRPTIVSFDEGLSVLKNRILITFPSQSESFVAAFHLSKFHPPAITARLTHRTDFNVFGLALIVEQPKF